MINGRFRVLLFAAAILTQACSPGPAPGMPAPTEPRFAAAPPAPVRPVTETLHGTVVTDPYRYLEDLTDPEVVDWLRAQDAHARSVLDGIPGRGAILEELAGLAGQSPISVPSLVRAGERYVYLKDVGGGIRALHLRDDLHGAERLLTGFGSPDTDSRGMGVGRFTPSPDGRRLLMLTASGGSEVGMLHVFDVERGALMADSIPAVFDLMSPGSRMWRPDGGAFGYRPLGESTTGSATDLETGRPILFHVIGTPIEQDQAVFGHGVSPHVPVPREAWPTLEFSPASPYVLGTYGLTIHAVHMDSLRGPATPWRQVTFDEDAVARGYWVQRGEHLYFISRAGAARHKVVRKRLDDPEAAAELLVPESDAVVHTLHPAADALYVVLLDGARHRLLRVQYDGSAREVITLPYDGAVALVIDDARVPGIVFGYTSGTKGTRLLRYVPGTGVLDTGLLAAHPGEALIELESRVTEARSADGTMVPIAIVRPAGLARGSPAMALLEVYATSGVFDYPLYRNQHVAWHRRGGIVAECHARGGGAKGAEWHHAGRRENLPNKTADVIACAEYLIENGYTTPERQVISGVSAGGFPAAAAAVQRPDLFTAVELGVPVLDMLRFEFERNGPPHIGEYGSVTTPEGFRTLLAVSPLANVRDGTAYPAVLLLTGMNDRRVSPAQAAKFAARLQAATASRRPVLLTVDPDAGHNASGTRAALADRLAFLLWQVGHPDFQPNR
jgi:prolyl oligopeptidase